MMVSALLGVALRVSHIGLLMIALIALGLVVLPKTVSLFAGEHLFYEVNEGYGSRCIKCHADVYEELKSGANHSTVDGTEGWSGEECLGCHRANSSIQYANATGGSQPGREAHAASTIHCGYCHFDRHNDLGPPVAGGFGLSNLPSNDTGVYASHYSFVVQSKDAMLVLNESESCIACHTSCNLTINFNVSVKSKAVVDNTLSGWEFESLQRTAFENYTEERK